MPIFVQQPFDQTSQKKFFTNPSSINIDKIGINYIMEPNKYFSVVPKNFLYSSIKSIVGILESVL